MTSSCPPDPSGGPARPPGILLATAITKGALFQLASELSTENVLVLAGDFLADSHQLHADIQRQLAEGNLAETQRLAHSLKGTSAIFALNDLHESAATLEQSCKSGVLDDIHAAAAQLTPAVELARDIIQQAIAALEQKASTT